MIEGISAPLQLSWIVDYVPDWLGPTLLGSGLLLVVFTFLSFSYSGDGDESTSLSVGTFALLSIGVGGGFLAVPLYRRYTFAFAAGLLLAGRWIEGVAATRLLTKVIRFFSGTGTGSLSGTLKRRLRRMAIVVLVLLLAGWTALWVVLFGPVVVSQTYDLTLIWTTLVGVLSLLGLGFKFTSVDNRVYLIEPRFVPMLLGLILAVTGAQLYNFEILQQVLVRRPVELNISLLDPLLLFAGQIVYLGGYYWSIRQRLREL
jgi:hypothetical protein